MATGAVRVEGLSELERALKASDRDLAKGLRKELRDAGKVVSVDARSKLSRFGGFTALGIRPRVRRGVNVSVEQSRRRTTGKRPDFGGLQMRVGLEPALDENRAEVERRVEDMLDRIGRENGF